MFPELQRLETRFGDYALVDAVRQKKSEHRLSVPIQAVLAEIQGSSWPDATRPVIAQHLLESGYEKLTFR